MTHIVALVQDCSNSIANALEILQSCTKPTLYAPLGFRYLWRNFWWHMENVPDRYQHISQSYTTVVCFRVHDDVIKWKHFPRYWPFVRGIHRSPLNSPHKGQWRGALMFSLICVWINGWVNNREAGDLRRYRAHYDVTVMCTDVTVTVPVRSFILRRQICMSKLRLQNKSAKSYWPLNQAPMISIRWNIRTKACYTSDYILNLRSRQNSIGQKRL